MPPVPSPALFAAIARSPVEVFVAAYLDREGGLAGMRHVIGTRDTVVPPIRLLAADALGFGAHGLVVAHNHPSGDASPSAFDLALTRRLARAFEALEAVLHDHLILAGERVTSLRALGYL